MSRRLLGVFDPSARFPAQALSRWAESNGARLLRDGPMQVALSGPPPRPGAPLVVFDGQLDNAEELGKALGLSQWANEEELLALGHRHWGNELPSRMRGDFTLTIWEGDRMEGLIARDQMGARSLYLHEIDGALVFAGEIRDLLQALPRRPAPDPASVAHWVAVSNRPGSHTMFAGIRRLDPGAMLLLDRHGARSHVYWRPRFEEPAAQPPERSASRLRSVLDTAVARRIVHRGQTGVLMSGGLDSTSVAAIAAREAPGRVTAHAGVFPQHPVADESGLIEDMRTSLGLSGITASVRAGGLLASAIESLRAWQSPLLGWGDFWTLPLLRAAAADGVTVTLGGDGGDELFGVRAYLLADELLTGRARRTIRLAREMPGAGDRPPSRQVARVIGAWALEGALPHRPQSAWHRMTGAAKAPPWLRPASAREFARSDDPHAWKRLDGPRWWAHTAHSLTRGLEETGIFEHQRRRAALAGLTARHPLLDLDLVELALRLPPQDSYDRHLSRPLLRRAMAGTLPDVARLRPGKAWFEALIVDCLTGPDGPVARRLLSESRTQLGAFVDLDRVRLQLAALTGERGIARFRAMHLIWRLLTAECWLRLQEDSSGSTLPSAEELSAPDVRLCRVGPPTARSEPLTSADSKNGHSYVFPP